MDKKNKKDVNVNYYDEPVVADEMQKAVSFEIEHKVLWLWYVLYSFTMPFTTLIFSASDSEPAAVPNVVQILIMIQYGIMYFCLSLYNIRAAKKGVLDSFSQWQKGGKGLMWTVGFLNMYCPMGPMITYFIGKGDNIEIIRSYLPFFIVWFCMAMAYYAIGSYSVYLNKKVRDGIAADDEAEETEEE